MSLQGICFAKSLSKFSIKRLVWPLIWVSGVEKRMVQDRIVHIEEDEENIIFEV